MDEISALTLAHKMSHSLGSMSQSAYVVSEPFEDNADKSLKNI